jgi:hypothetical protein
MISNITSPGLVSVADQSMVKSVLSADQAVTVTTSSGTATTSTNPDLVDIPGESNDSPPVSPPHPIPVLTSRTIDSLVASWPPTTCRHFLVHPLGKGPGYVDTPLDAASVPDAVACSVPTIEQVIALIPPVGAGRSFVLHIASTSQTTPTRYAEVLDRTKIGGYKYDLVRGWTAWLDQARYPCWCYHDRDLSGYVTSLTGPNNDGTFTVSSVDNRKVPVLTVADGGDSFADDAVTLRRLRFTGNVTPELQGMRAVVYKSSSGTLSLCWRPSDRDWNQQDPAPGDTFWLETPGACVERYLEGNGSGAEWGVHGSHVPAMQQSWLVGVAIYGTREFSCILGNGQSTTSYSGCTFGNSSLAAFPPPSRRNVVCNGGSSLNFTFNYPTPDGSPDGTETSLAANVFLNAVSLNGMFAPLMRVQWDDLFGCTASGEDVNHGSMKVYAEKIGNSFLTCSGVFLTGLSVYATEMHLGAAMSSENEARLMRVRIVLEAAIGPPGQSISIHGVSFDDAVLKLGSSSSAALGCNILLDNLFGGPVTRASNGATGKKTGIYCRKIVCCNILIDQSRDGAASTLTGADGDILLTPAAGGDWTQVLDYEALTTSDYKDCWGNHWIGRAGVNSSPPNLGAP